MKDPPASLRKSLIRDRVRRRRVPVKTRVVGSGYRTLSDAGSVVSVSRSVDRAPKPDPEADQEIPPAETHPQSRSAKQFNTPPPKPRSSCGFENNIECSLGSSPFKGSPFRHSPCQPPQSSAQSNIIYAAAVTPSTTQPAYDLWTASFSLSRMENLWNPSFSQSAIDKLWNPSFATPRSSPNGSLWNPSFDSSVWGSPKEIMCHPSFHSSISQLSTACSTAQPNNLSRSKETSPSKSGLMEWADNHQSTGFEFPLDNNRDVEWSDCHTVGSGRRESILEPVRMTSIEDCMESSTKFSDTVKILPSGGKWGAEQRHPETLRLQTPSREDTHQKVIRLRKITKMENQVRTSSPKDREVEYIKRRLQYMMEWTDSITARGAVVTPDRKSWNDVTSVPFDEQTSPSRVNIQPVKKMQQQSRLEQTLQRHVVSVDTTSPSVFSEDDSLFDNPYLRDAEKLSPNRVLNDDATKRNNPVFTFAETKISSPDGRVFNQNQVDESRAHLMENAAQEVVWPKKSRKSSSQRLPPIHSHCFPLTSKDKIIHNEADETNVTASPPTSKYFLTKSDHPTDAAAESKWSKTLVFGPQNDCPDPEGAYDEGPKLNPIPVQGASTSFPATRNKMDPEGCMSIDSWEMIIIGSRSSAAVSAAGCQEAVKPDDNNIHSRTLKLSRQLETKLEMLRKGASVPVHLSANEYDKSMLSSRVSIVSIQPSVETSCVRQNADIAMMMEDALMSCIVMDGEEEVFLQRAASQVSGLFLQPPLIQYPSEPVPSQESHGSAKQSYSPDESHSTLKLPFGQLQYSLPLVPAPKPVLDITASRHQHEHCSLSNRHSPGLSSVDEEEQFSEPNCNIAGSVSSTDSLLIQSSMKSSSLGEGFRIIIGQTDPVNILHRFRDNSTDGCERLKDEDFVSSSASSEENSQGNPDNCDNEMDVYSDNVAPLPFRKGMSSQTPLQRSEDIIAGAKCEDVLDANSREDAGDEDTGNSVDVDRSSPQKFMPVRSRAKISPQVLSSRVSLSSMSSYQASIREHFRTLSNYDSADQKLGNIKECSRIDDSSDDEAVDNDATPEYEYDDFVKDFSSIAANSDDLLEQRDDQALEFRSIGDEEAFTSDRFLDQNHPHSVAASEVSRSILEQNLREVRVDKAICGYSVATSDLESMRSRQALFKNKYIPKRIFHRTHPSRRSSPSILANSINASTLLRKGSQLQPELAVKSNIYVNDSVIISRQQMQRENSLANSASSVAGTDEQLAELRSIKRTPQYAKNKTTSMISGATSLFTKPISLLATQPGDHLVVANHEDICSDQPSTTGVDALRLKYQQLMSGTSSGVDQVSRIDTPRDKSGIAKISTFWKQLEFSGDASVDKPRPILKPSRTLTASDNIHCPANSVRSRANAFSSAWKKGPTTKPPRPVIMKEKLSMRIQTDNDASWISKD